MAKTSKRNRDYYERRLIAEHPLVYADFQAGRYPSITSACQSVGLMAIDTPLKALMRSWGKANSAERDEFLASIGAKVGAPATVSAVPDAATIPARPLPAATRDGHLEPWARSRIQEIMVRRVMTKGVVMDELGFERLNPSLWLAMRSTDRSTKIRAALMIAALGKWLEANRDI